MKNNQNPNRRDIIKTFAVATAAGFIGGSTVIHKQETDKRNEASTLGRYRSWRQSGPGRGFSSAFARYRR